MYKFGVGLMKYIMLTLAVAAIMSYHFQGLTAMTIGLIAAAVLGAFFFALMAADLHSRQKNQPTTDFSFIEQQEPVGALALVPPPAEREVMWYKGLPFNCFNSDPTAPDPVA